jgi:formylglycine-generating enzyme
MLRKTPLAPLAALVALGTVALAMAQERKQADGSRKQITNLIGMKLILIPAGEFKMGSGESALQTDAFFRKNYGMGVLVAPPPPSTFDNEHPQHRVRITKPFYLGTYHVTRGQFRRFINDSGYKIEPGAKGWVPEKNVLVFNKDYSWRNAGFEQTDEHPVVNVSWNDAVAFCKWLSNKEGKTYRLPTEAEWEYACRAGTTTRYYSGDDPETLAKVANVADATFRAKFPAAENAWCAIKASDGYVYTSPVGQFKPNAFGLYDMHGNAWHLCADWYGGDSDYYRNSPTDDPKGPEKGGDRVVRGGSWLACPDAARSACRTFIQPSDRDNVVGFRIVRAVGERKGEGDKRTKGDILLYLTQ